MKTPEEIIDDVKTRWALGQGVYNGASIVGALDAAGYVIVPKKLLEEISITMRHARTFVASRQKIKHPEGIHLYDCCLTMVDLTIAAAQNSSGHKEAAPPEDEAAPE